jgi:hypothetical protein
MLVVRGGGLYPPNIEVSNNGSDSRYSATRWSSGLGCFAYFSSSASTYQVSIPIIPGPDWVGQTSWEVISQEQDIKFSFNQKLNLIQFTLSKTEGWQNFSIKQPGCYNNGEAFTKSEKRADDRPLCYLIGDITIKTEL